MYSFNGNKIITTSGGGMLVSDDKEKIEKVKFWATQAREKAMYYEHKEIGYNYRMSNICAGIGRGQMKVLDERIAQKTAIYERYKETLEKDNDFEMIPIPNDSVPNHWLSVAIVKNKEKYNPTQIIEMLSTNNIEARRVWKPMHLQPVFKDCDFIKVEEMPVADYLFENGVCFPSDTKMTKEEQDRVIYVINS